MQQPSTLRDFVRRPIGRALLLAFAILVTFGAYAYVSVLLAIPIILVVGLAFPIYLGIKRLRTLAIMGLVILLAVAPLANLVITQDVRTPIGPAASPNDLPGSNGSIMQDAFVRPYTGLISTNFTWNVTVYPQNTARGNSTPLNLTLYLSTCPGATGPDDLNCNTGYPLYTENVSWPGGLTAQTTVQFHFTFPAEGIWSWQMGLYVNNTTTHALTFILLVGDPVYNGLEGPVIGDFASTYEILILTVYLNDFVYLGIPFFVVLLIYAYLKRRQTQRTDAAARAMGPATPPDAPPAGKGAASNLPTDAPNAGKRPPPAARRPELSCPNCGAVVYSNESTCWKCGKPLPPAGGSAPLASGT